MKKSLFTFVVLLMVLGVAVNTARSESITYSLNSFLNGTGTTSSSASLGTITFSDNGNFVNVNVSLANSSWKLLDFQFNFDDCKFSNNSTLTLSNESLRIAENAVRPDGYPGYLDLEVPRTGSLTGSTYSGVLKYNWGVSDLDVNDFTFLDTTNSIFASAHIGNYNSSGDSVWVGATPSTAVPEPSTMLMLGFGLVAVAGCRKKFAVAAV